MNKAQTSNKKECTIYEECIDQTWKKYKQFIGSCEHVMNKYQVHNEQVINMSGTKHIINNREHIIKIFWMNYGQFMNRSLTRHEKVMNWTCHEQSWISC